MKLLVYNYFPVVRLPLHLILPILSLSLTTLGCSDRQGNSSIGPDSSDTASEQTDPHEDRSSNPAPSEPVQSKQARLLAWLDMDEEGKVAKIRVELQDRNGVEVDLWRFEISEGEYESITEFYPRHGHAGSRHQVDSVIGSVSWDDDGWVMVRAFVNDLDNQTRRHELLLDIPHYVPPVAHNSPDPYADPVEDSAAQTPADLLVLLSQLDPGDASREWALVTHEDETQTFWGAEVTHTTDGWVLAEFFGADDGYRTALWYTVNQHGRIVKVDGWEKLTDGSRAHIRSELRDDNWLVVISRFEFADGADEALEGIRYQIDYTDTIPPACARFAFAYHIDEGNDLFVARYRALNPRVDITVIDVMAYRGAEEIEHNGRHIEALVYDIISRDVTDMRDYPEELKRPHSQRLYLTQDANLIRLESEGATAVMVSAKEAAQRFNLDLAELRRRR